MSNLVKSGFKSKDFDVYYEIQNVNFRVMKKGTMNQVGVCSIVGGELSQGIPKMLFIDSQQRTKSHTIIKGLLHVMGKLGFEKICFQKALGGAFETSNKEI
jgi:hypothetical protein